MVQIRRGSTASKTSWISWRTVLLFVIGLQGMRLLYKLGNTATTESLLVSSSSGGLLSLDPPPQLRHVPPKVVHANRKQVAGDTNHANKKASQSKEKQLPQRRHPNPHDVRHHGATDSQDGVHPDVHKAERATDDGVHASNTQPKEPKNPTNVWTQRGTGSVAQMGYVVDLVAEREHASFRTTRAATNEAQQLDAVTKLLHTERKTTRATLQSCVLSKGTWAAACQPTASSTTTTLYAYNAAPFARYYCSVRIESHQAIPLPSCQTMADHYSQVSVFPRDIAHTSPKENLPDTTILSQASAGSSLDKMATRTVTCPVPCAFEDSIKLASLAQSSSSGRALTEGVVKLTVHGPHSDWTILHSMDDPYTNGNAKIERTNYRRNVYYSTVSQLSSVPLSFYDVAKYPATDYAKHVVDWTKAADKVTYLLDEECTAGRRNKWLAAVVAVMNVQAYGKCQHSTNLGPGQTLETLEGRLALMRQNRVTLVLEQGTDKDYITSLVYEALLAGNVPAIVGAGNLDVRLPPHAAIYSSQFNSWDKFAAHIRLVASNQTLYEAHQAWRRQPDTVQAFVDTFEFTKTSPECRLCQWALAKQYGWGWNHTRQTIQATRLSRTLCHAKNLVTHPFGEEWRSVASTRDTTSTTRRALTEAKACTSGETHVHGEISSSSYKVERTVLAHDGVIDMVIAKVEHGADNEMVLRLTFDTIRNTEGAYFRDTHALVTEANHVATVSSASLQDDVVKVTVLANWVTRLHSPGEGLLDVTIASGTLYDTNGQRRIRIIMEDMNPLHDKMTEFFPSTFGRQMMHDFMDPLELYYDA